VRTVRRAIGVFAAGQQCVGSLKRKLAVTHAKKKKFIVIIKN
jgi:hypothetical protein